MFAKARNTSARRPRSGITSLAYLPLASIAYRVAFARDPEATGQTNVCGISPEDPNTTRCTVSST